MADTAIRRPPPVGRSLLGLALFAAAAAAAALIGVFAATGTAAEYAQLRQPAWAPPSWVFGPVWTVLYVLIALAGWQVWRRRGWSGARAALALYGVQLVLNAAWTPLFFAADLRALAFVDIVALVVVLTATIAAFRRASGVAAVLLVPYWAWTVFAAALNLAVWQLNTGA
ncbi:TspO/MBR family protein [Streptomonospora litoralis]|uniref:TspO/MBR family protein n=1 Tax=Streptomonospora litoralis TaxID=2498135 RepID=A0A4P6PVX4_9ACTN|nr:TspO/MBR family protein [Streptomonospora litoralis]QBI52243.1 TspO/MBR family protein [Streptomonospora litoralis]